MIFCYVGVVSRIIFKGICINMAITKKSKAKRTARDARGKPVSLQSNRHAGIVVSGPTARAQRRGTPQSGAMGEPRTPSGKSRAR